MPASKWMLALLVVLQGTLVFGAVPEHAKACAEEWTKLSKGRSFSGEEISFVSDLQPDGSSYMLSVFVGCEGGKLHVKKCQPWWNLETAPGTYARSADGVFKTCPSKSAHTAAQILEEAVMEKTAPGVLLRVPTGFKAVLPEGIGQHCAADWDKLTLGGKRKADAGGYVEIAKAQVISTPSDFDGGDVVKTSSGDTRTFTSPIWVRFTCPSDTNVSIMKFEHCRFQLKGFQKLSGGKYFADHHGGFFYNCGGTAKSGVANIGELVTISKTPTKGLVEQMKLS